MTSVICHTPGCLNEDIPVELETTYVDDGGQTRDVDAVICGPCGEPITNVREAS